VPIARYFILVGGTLAVLLFIAGWYFPTPPAMFSNQTTVFDETIIRIRSERKWPEKIVLDTSRPTMMPPLAIEERRVAQLVPLPSDEPGAQTSLEAKVQWKLDTRPPTVNHPTSQIKRRVARTARSTHAAGSPIVRRLARAEPGGGCCQFGRWIDNGQASTNTMPRRRAAAPWPD
jgi:hypothetical protein